jgi:D-arabinose 1-dehydrogenase-like Zn-dependent alcohol dehydrogenase
MGSPRDFENMLSFVRRERIVPVVDSVVAMRCGDGDEGADTTRVVAAMERMRNGKQMGKIVIQVGRSSSRRQPDCEIPSRL